MATNFPGKDSLFLLRLQTLIIGGGTNVVRNIFNNRLNNLPLVTFLANEEATINSLQENQTITKAHYDQLFPQGGHSPDSGDFDITLLMCLLRNMPSLGLNIRYPWHTSPGPTDMSVEADLIRLRTFRNEISYTSTTHGLDELTYKQQWNKVEQCLIRLNSGPHFDPNLQATIDSLRNSPFYPASEQRLDKQWQELWKSLESEKNIIKEDIIYTRKSIGEETGDVGKVKGEKRGIEKVERDIDVVTRGADNAKQSFKKQRREDVSREENVQEEGRRSVNDLGRIIAQGYTTLVDYIKPEPVLDYAMECKLFRYREVRDLKEEKNTSERNRMMLEKVRQKGDAGFKKFKECLKRSGQAKIADFLDCIERGIDTSEIKSQIAEEATKGSLHGQSVMTTPSSQQRSSSSFRTVRGKFRRKRKRQSVMTTPNSQQRSSSSFRTVRGKFRRKRKRQSVMTTPNSQQRSSSSFRTVRGKFRRKRKHLQEDLIDSYRSDHSKMSLGPLLDKSTPLLQFFQMPDLEHVTERIELGRAAKEKRTTVDTWDELFHDSNHGGRKKTCRSFTYICADAGLGKTAFSKYLTLAWCESKKPLRKESQFFSLEHLKAIEKFSFVFLLFLRDSGERKCHLKEMIWEQLVSKLICPPEPKDLDKILRDEKCLIILDGLDEWTHPPTCGKREQVPHWSKRKNVAVITTTRPWKFSVAGLKSDQVDQRIELTGLNDKSADKLKYSFMSYFKMQELKVKCLEQQDKDEVERNVQKFTETVSDKHATKLESVPLMLMYMLFLYMYGFNLGETQCDLYCRITEFLLSRAFEEEQEIVTSTTEKIPSCFKNRTLCLKFYNPYLKPLGELAFKTLLEEKREEKTLVFDSSMAIECLGEECFKQCLKTGIISQSKCVQTDLLFQKSTVSFSHKTMQEFFAALYMYSEPDETRMSQLVLSKCKNVQDILKMSKIIMFISGMNVNVAALISYGMMNIINEDEITEKYRNTAELGSYEQPLKDLQNMFVSCCKEMPCASGDNLYIHDVFFAESCKDEQYRVNIKQLIHNNKNNIKSVYINMLLMQDTPYNSGQKVVEYFELKDLENLVKISCDEGDDTEDIIPVLNTQVKCLQLVRGSWSRSLFEKVTSLQKLEAIHISLLTMSHSELRLLYDFISQRVDMRQIELENLKCSDHGWRPCSGVSIDLSRHSQLRELSLWHIPQLELKINMTSLEGCVLEDLSLSSLVFTHGTCDTVNTELNRSDVRLSEVTIPASVLKDLVSVIQTLPHTVCVGILRCVIKPKSEWKTLKQQIKKSKHFTMLKEYRWLWFQFETIKHEN